MAPYMVVCLRTAPDGRSNDAQARVEFLSGNGAHEVQHSVTDRTPAASYTWMEEGIANVFSRSSMSARTTSGSESHDASRSS